MMTLLKCDHCLLEFPEREAVCDEIRSQKKVFCCHGCQGIYRLIHEEGLENFYEKRKWDEAGSLALLFQRDIDLKPFAEQIRDMGDGEEKEIDIYIDGIRCASCVWLNEKILSRTEGIKYARVNYATHRAKIRWAPAVVGLERIFKRILSIGYEPKPCSESEQFKMQKAASRDLLVRFGTAGFLSSQLMIYSTALYAGYFQGIDASTKFRLEIIAMLLTIPVLLYSGMPFIRSSWQGLRHLHFNMDALITIGAGSAFIYSTYQIFTGGKVYFDTTAMIITLILLGRYIESSAKGRASETIERLFELKPKEARLIIDRQPAVTSQEVQIVPISSIQKGDLVQVVPGERIPLDGLVIGGDSEADESIITGESRPVPKKPGSEVIGGSMNLYGTLVFKVAKTGPETVLANIIRAVEDAQAHKPAIQTLAERIVRFFVPAILTLALFTIAIYLIKGASFQAAMMTGISVLVIACPCSLGLATPLAILVFTGMASSKGILIRSGEVIENAGRLDHVIFDKTGTVTIGRPVLRDIVVFDEALSRSLSHNCHSRPDRESSLLLKPLRYWIPAFAGMALQGKIPVVGQTPRDYILSIVASVERLSEHSIGHAITEAAKGLEVFAVSDFRAKPGRGIESFVDGHRVFIGSREFMDERGINNPSGEYISKRAADYASRGDTVIFAALDETITAMFVIADVVRKEAPEVVHRLQEMGMEVSIVSGDNSLTTASIASAIGTGSAMAGASPVRKKEVVREIQAQGGKVIMVGDGINDAPALTEALIGMAMGRGTDIAIESADAVLMKNDLRLVPYFISLSKRTLRIIKQNIFWAFFYNIVAIPLAVSGLLHPIFAAGAMAASSLFVVGNSLRIRGARGSDQI
ncbi:MAG: heavy metal translocating P-type ATPase [Candidatus Tectomicrobia bacterium]|uniref:Heavy metal translocating P-type ATPase n=1 Tax=Tectimicrobiota bacterium TaxID=2528274 RepID=A0A933LQA8_UNCTE|nr:heavy metal translocating P-type ATPase [Candidatus Tectomicrobia bacterium]